MVEEIAREVDRQLSVQGAQSDGFAARAGVLLAATALLTGFLNGRAAIPDLAVWSVGISSGLGVFVLLLARLVSGPSPSQMARWTHEHPPTREVLDAKLLALEANSRALLRTEVFFFAQAVLTILAIASLIYSSQANQ